MSDRARKYLRVVLPLICFVCALLMGYPATCLANGSEMVQRHSKDYKQYPAGSPEAVLTAFVEADLDNVFNRQDDDRYPVWWDLTELGGAQDSYQELIINSYEIDRVPGGQPADLILNLKVDVKMIWVGGNANDTSSDWLDRTVYFKKIKMSLSPVKSFMTKVFGEDSKTANKIIDKVSGYYDVPKKNSEWVFPIRMVKKNTKWVISMESIPLQLSIARAHSDWYKKLYLDELAFDEVCNGTRKIDNYIMGKYAYGDVEKIGRNVNMFTTKYCTYDAIFLRQKIIRAYKTTINTLDRSD